MRYKLQRNANGMITQCENADGGNVYAQREEINKKALENLQRATPGKLGNLSNLQIFNFEISNIETGTDNFIIKEYNAIDDFPANASRCVMFGVDGLSNKALYYNIVSVNASIKGASTTQLEQTLQPSLISFYLLQNINGSTTSLGTKIPQPSPLFGVGGGAVDFTTSGPIYGNQSILIDLDTDSGFFAQNNDTKGLRCSGLALKDIICNFAGDVQRDNVVIDVSVFVDVSSVSSTY